MVITTPVIGPVLGQLTAAYPMRRSTLIFGVLVATVAIWTLVPLWPGPAPLPVVVALLLVLASYGPASGTPRPRMRSVVGFSRPSGQDDPPRTTATVSSCPRS